MAAPPPAPEPSPRILLLDDEPHVLKALERALVSEAFEVRFTTDADTALALLAAAPADVVVSDYRMPRVDGVTFLERVREQAPQARRVLLTGHADIQAIADAINHGAIHRLLLKPWDHLDLVVALREESRQGRLSERADELRRLADRKANELELARRLLRVQRLAAVGQLAAGLAHEINNPLGTILAFSQILLRDQRLVPENLEAVQFIEQAAQRCRRVIDAVVKFGVPSSAAPGEVKIDDLIRETVGLLEPEIRRANAALKIDVESPTPATRGSFQELEQVVTALLRNALEALPGPSGERSIALRGFRRGGLACLSVHDSGRGIALEIRDRIFDPFFSTKAEGEAAGLGLTIAERIAQTHGGQLELVSEPGGGTTATLSLPELPANS
ncbi:MAG TPA: ATP-binding protein [Myxococcales bacterium]|nr:ATP-binding protein [Myxococcales bacterium]